MADRNIEVPRQTALQASNDILPHQAEVDKAIKTAQEYLERYEAGGETRTKFLAEMKKNNGLSRILSTLRQLREAEKDGVLVALDEQDGSYDRRDDHRSLNSVIGRIRNLDIDLNRMWGTRWARKIGAWFGESIPNWWSVEWRAFKDNAKHFMTTAAVVGVAGAGLTVGGYALAHGGFTPGLNALGGHLSQAGSFMGTQLSRLVKRTP